MVNNAEYIITINSKHAEHLAYACNQAMRIHIGQLSDPLTVLLNFELGYSRHHNGEPCPLEVQESLDDLSLLCWGTSYGYGYDEKSKSYWELYQIFKNASDSMVACQVELTANQVEHLRTACEQAARLRCGQLDYSLEMELMSAYERRYKDDEERLKRSHEVRAQINNTFDHLHTLCWELPGNADYGLNYNEDSDILWDMYQIFRHQLWKEAHPNPSLSDKMTVDGDNPYQTGIEPLISIMKK